MTRIALVVSDVDGTLLTKDKILTDGARAAVRRLHAASIGFTIVDARSFARFCSSGTLSGCFAARLLRSDGSCATS